MSVEVATQIVTLALAVFAIIWHQQRTTEKLRDEFNQAHSRLRDELNNAIDKLREEFTQAINSLRDAVAGNGQRIARIEGFLKIGMPADATAPEPSSTEPTASPSAAANPAVEPATGG